MADTQLRIHISGTGMHLDEDTPYLKCIVRAIFKNGCTVTRYWFEMIRTRHELGLSDDDNDWETIHQENEDTISKSDLVIVDATHDYFYQGYQALVSAQRKKPTLVVTRSPIKGRFISGIASKYITLKTYQTEDELEALVTKFIKANTIPAKDLRFNFIIDRQIHRYLRDKSYETGRNKSEIIREILLRKIGRRP